MRTRPLVAAAVAIVSLASGAFAGTINIPSDFASIQVAIDAANNGDTIIVAPGTYAENIDFGGKLILVRSSGGSDVTTITPATDALPVVSFTSSEDFRAVLDGFTIRDASGASAIFIVRAGPTIQNCDIRENVTSTDGAGIYCGQSAAVIRKCTIRDNVANGTADGGGLYIEGDGGEVIVEECRFIDNKAWFGSGIAGYTTTNVYISHSLFVRNTGPSTYAGAIYLYGTNSTIANNTCYDNTRGICIAGGDNVEIFNNIVTNSVGDALILAGATADYNCFWDNFYEGNPGPNGIIQWPSFADTAAGDFRLNQNSPCIDRGVPDPAYDDPDGTRSDIGAFAVVAILPLAENARLLGEQANHVVSHNPTFIWSFVDSVGTPSAYEIQVGNDLDWSVAELWSTGQVLSGDSTAAYAGNPLVDGTKYWARVRLFNGTSWGGWSQFSFSMNQVPSPPALIAPTDGAVLHYQRVKLTVGRVVDPDGGLVNYALELFADAALSQPIADFTIADPGSGDNVTSGYLDVLTPNGEYWWRSRVSDGHEFSDYTTVRSFTVRDTQTVYVPTGYATIAQAIAALGPGDVIELLPGTYTEFVTFPEYPLTIRSSTGAAATRIRASGTSNPVISFANQQGRNSRLLGITIDGDSITRGALCYNASPTIDSCIFENCDSSGIASAIDCRSGGPKISNSTFRYNLTDCISANGAPAIPFEITHNLFHDNIGRNGTAIWIVNNATGMFANNIISNNRSSSTVVPVVNVAGHDVEIRNNTIANSRTGIYVYPEFRVKLIGNIIAYCSEYAISPLDASLINGPVQYNCFWQVAKPFPGDPTNFTADPHFLNLELSDFRLSQASPCIDAGDPDPTQNDPDGSRNDVGAIPFDPAVYPYAGGFRVVEQTFGFVRDSFPTFEWNVTDYGSPVQTRYQVQLDDNGDWTNSAFWDSGPVASPIASCKYSGPPLPDNTRMHFRIRIHNGAKWGAWVVSTFFIRYVRTYRVPSEHATITDAIALTDAGDIVLVEPGNYTEQLVFPSHPIELVGEMGNEATFFQDNLSKAAGAIVISNGGAGHVIRGFTFDRISQPTNVILVSGDSSAASVTDCRFFDCRGSAVSAINYATIHVSRSLFIDCDTYAISADQLCAGCTAINNTVAGGYRGIKLLGVGSVIINNIVSGMRSRAVEYQYAAASVNYNCLWNNAENNNPGGDGFIADPLFVDPLSLDFRLTELSPCIDAGHPDAIYNDPDSSRNDIGAFVADRVEPFAIQINLGGDFVNRVISDTPTVCWSVSDPLGATTGFQIQVNSSPNWAQIDMWDTGEMYSSDTSIAYDGLPLVDGMVYWLRLRLLTPSGSGSWSFLRFRMNTPPNEPTLQAPPEGAVVSTTTLQLQCLPMLDFERDTLTYHFEIYRDSLFNSMVYHHELFDSTFDPITPIVTGIDSSSTYWWRCRAFDGFEHSPWSPTWSFDARLPDTLNVPGEYPTIQSAVDQAIENDLILVAPGEYTENVVVNGKSLFIISSGGPAFTIVRPANTKSPVFRFVDNVLTGTTLRGFTITGITRASVIAVESNSVVLIEENVFHHNIDAIVDPLTVINVPSGTEATIHRNLFYENKGINCILVRGIATVTNNTFVNNARGVYGLLGSKFTFLNNLVAFNDDYGVDGHYTTLDYCLAWQNGSDNNAGPNGIVADPKLVDMFDGDFHLAFGSPCIDAGHPGAIYLDPDSSRNDIGAFPFEGRYPFVFDIGLGNEAVYHVTDHNPDMFWSYEDSLPAQQSAYHIQVGTDEDWSDVENWDSGPVTSVDTTATYDGSPLEDGQKYFVRLRVKTNADWGTWGSISFKMNTMPTSPVPISPDSGGMVHVNGTALTCTNAADGDGDVLLYTFEMYTDSELTSLAGADSLIAEQSAATSSKFFSVLSVYTEYFWRCQVWDGFETSAWSPVQSFTTRPAGVLNVPGDHPNIQQAIDASGEGDTILVQPGTYRENLDLGSNDIVLKSTGGREVTTLSTQSSTAVISITGGQGRTTTVDGFTIENDNKGRGIYIVSSAPTIQNCEVRYCYNGGDGGGIHGASAGALIRNCYIHHNRSNTTGGGICQNGNHTMPMEIVDNIIANNEGDAGPGIGMLYHHRSIITRNLIYRNKGLTTYGAGIYCSGGNTVIVNNTVVINSKGIYLRSTNSDTTINNIIAFNELLGLESNSKGDDYNLDWTNSNTTINGSNTIVADPKFVDTLKDIFMLRSGSPCIDAGHPDAAYNDADGSVGDIGALPYVPFPRPAPPVLISPSSQMNQITFDLMPTFVWHSAEISTLDSMLYDFILAADSTFDFAQRKDSLVDTTLTWQDSLLFGHQYFWRVIAENRYGEVDTSDIATFYVGLPGDVNGTGVVDIVDITYLVQFMFGLGPAVEPLALADVNADCKIDISDLVYMIVYFFKDGPAPLAGCMNAVDARPTITRSIE